MLRLLSHATTGSGPCLFSRASYDESSASDRAVNSSVDAHQPFCAVRSPNFFCHQSPYGIIATGLALSVSQAQEVTTHAETTGGHFYGLGSPSLIPRIALQERSISRTKHMLITPSLYQ